MELTYFLTTLGLIPYITSRAFLPLFASALIARYGPQWRPLADLTGVQLLDAVPGWAVSDAALTTLGILALVEVAANKSSRLRELLSFTDTQVKGIAAFVFCLALAGPLDPSLGPILGTTLPVVQSSALGLSVAVLWALMVGSGTWFLAGLRKGIYHFLMEVDGDDELGLQKLLSWMEDGFGFLGALFVVLLPALALAVTGLTLLALYLLQKYLERQEEKRKVPCGDCGTPNPLCGPFCARCGKERSPSSRWASWARSRRFRSRTRAATAHSSWPANVAAAAANGCARRDWTRDARPAAPCRSKAAVTSRPTSAGCKESCRAPCSCCWAWERSPWSAWWRASSTTASP